VQKKLNVPLKLSVKGCPVIIEKDVVGMTAMKSAIPGKGDSQLLHLGFACANADNLAREFFVRNYGSTAAKVRWTVNSATAKVNGPIKFEVSVDSDGYAKPAFKFWDDVTKEIPFSIEPISTVIPAYGRQKFKVTLLRTSLVGCEKALLTCSIRNSGGDNDKSQLHDSLAAASLMSDDSSASASKADFSLPLYVQSDITSPSVRIDKNIFYATDGDTQVSDDLGIKLKIEVPQLFSTAAIGNGKSRTIVVENPLMSTLLFSVTTIGPFQIKSSIDTSYIDKKGTFSALASKTTSSLVSSESKGSSLGRTIQLLPQVSAM